jgi:hypothetical protein
LYPNSTSIETFLFFTDQKWSVFLLETLVTGASCRASCNLFLTKLKNR